MSKKRLAITARMKVDALLAQIHQQFGVYLKDFEGSDLKPGDPVVFDHHHGLVFEGPHDPRNLRACLPKANQRKAASETRAFHKVRRLRGENKGRKSASVASSRFIGARAIAPGKFQNKARADAG